MRKIKLYGDLGAKFGREFNLSVSSPAEAIRALSYQKKGFKKFMIDSEKNGLQYRVFSHNNELSDVKELPIKASGDIKIVPVVVGANGEFRTLLGSALIAASFFTGPIGPYIFNTGVALAIGGAVEVLTRGMISNPIPPEKADNKPSYAFSGALNTTYQGQPVPIGYGTMIVGSAVISASLTTETLNAGYEYQVQEVYVDIWSYGTSNGYQKKPPPNWTSREELEYIEATTMAIGGLGSGQGTQYVPAKWLFRYAF